VLDGDKFINKAEALLKRKLRKNKSEPKKKNEWNN